MADEMNRSRVARQGLGASWRPDREQERFELLLELSRAFSARLDLDELLPLVLQRCKEVLGAEGCSILLLDASRTQLTFPATSSVTPGVDERLRGLSFPASHGVAGEVLRSGNAIRVSDVGRDAHFYSEVDELTGTRTTEMLCAPLRTHEGVTGVIEVLNCLEGSFDDEDLAFIDALAGSVAVAIENARLVDHIRQSEIQLQQEVTGLRREIVHRGRFSEVIGGSSAMQAVFSLMESAGDSAITVLLEGETGVGKEVIASAIHSNGPRSAAPFITINCGALPANLLESELFGFSRGAFTGATSDKQGLFEAADGGTLFLDEIGETPPDLQVKLLRALQEGEIRRIGETRPRQVDVRVISATNRDLATEVRERRFREDLYYRIRVFPILVPPLRERREDVPLLASFFLERIAVRLGKPVSSIDGSALERLVEYGWPGNVRELENELERAIALAPREGRIGLDCLSERIAEAVAPGEHASGGSVRYEGTLRTARRAFERDFVAEVLARHGGNATRAARELGISRQMLQRKIREYGLREAASDPARAPRPVGSPDPREAASVSPPVIRNR